MGKAKQERDNVANTASGEISDGTVIRRRTPTWHTTQCMRWTGQPGSKAFGQALNSFGGGGAASGAIRDRQVSKTQLAAHHARVLARVTDTNLRVDALVWATPLPASGITSAYTQTARHFFLSASEAPENTAQLFLDRAQNPVKHHNWRWLIIWDDLTKPSTMHDRWLLTEHPHSRMLVNHSLTPLGRLLLDVDACTPDEAQNFLTRDLKSARSTHTTTQLDSLALNLGHLPLPLDQTMTYDEGRSQIRTGNAPWILVTLYNPVIGLLQATGFDNIAKADRHVHRNETHPFTPTLPKPCHRTEAQSSPVCGNSLCYSSTQPYLALSATQIREACWKIPARAKPTSILTSSKIRWFESAGTEEYMYEHRSTALP
ncbi:hypothetical protein [Nocardiopsis dassonvillei]|uniref:hypothetical protein n=1 Tax=Nocardiopsis dassonvillei TaxID=2014 RepID=UPI003670E2D2